ncbi:Bax inhibitor-1/YccA family protein [Bowmanella sp. JS7-9]|uniref:Bax inhibitor-1/YccA family protein n=1 Tax=Pseudobowmanella zhangzhouensis TaxID=1537679 RepID=A0ABW1XJS1_9ALTE|nr:Bax inhibitor-1/YccA family protein [Bowmanella sp. JS7-9]TBX26010.1 membrane protein [Bowmanella sp. JS7-9]
MNQNTLYSASSQTAVLETNKVLRNTYSLLAMTLAFSAVVAGITMSMNLPYLGPWVTIIGFYGLLFLVHKTANSSAGLASVFALTGFMGYSIGPILSYYMAVNGGEIVMTALGGTALIFFATSGYVLTTKRDMSFLSGTLMIGSIVLIVAVIANLFLAMPALSLAISAMFMFFSSALIMYQTSEIINGGERNYILATVSLYVSIYNLFLSLLNLLSAFNSDD